MKKRFRYHGNMKPHPPLPWEGLKYRPEHEKIKISIHKQTCEIDIDEIAGKRLLGLIFYSVNQSSCNKWKKSVVQSEIEEIAFISIASES